ncbi:MAG: 4Fe-4S dicluster domain-containing protein [Natrialbaceae archaeon]|nr:4Fe-4S dicluster domain-containing protein [Natrialbaceae archaeon]
MVIDLERCDGCLSCVTGCIDENDTSTGANWMYVLTYEDEKTEQENFLVRPCQHCTNAPCEKVCPVRARHTRDKDGIVLTNYETCIGCRYCQVACPYGVNYFQWGNPDVPESEMMKTDTSLDELRAMGEEERVAHLNEEGDHTVDHRGWWVDSRPPKGTMGKCTFCPSRQDGVQGEEMVGRTACMDACDETGSNAIHFGDLKDPDSRPNRLLRQRAELAESREVATSDDPQEDRITGSATAEGELSAFKLLEDIGTKPNVTYLGNQPGPEAEQVEGPVSYDVLQSSDGREVTDRRKNHTDLGAAANQME